LVSSSDLSSAAVDADGTLAHAIQSALDALLRALELEPVGADRFRVVGDVDRFDRVFGGQTVAQALLAACTTVSGKDPHSFHAYFVEAGNLGAPLELRVERVRDGRSVSTRHVTVSQGDRTLLVMTASFQSNRTSPGFPSADPAVSEPDEVPVLQEWFREVPPELLPHVGNWIEQPPPLDLRIGEPPSFLSGCGGDGPRVHWMRLPRAIGLEPLLHAVLLAYASDYLLLDMVFRAHPARDGSTLTGYSLDHSLWYHAPVRLDRWHRHTQEAIAISGERGLARGSVHDLAGNLVATVMQEVLVRSGDR
jgi:acyl-CoA thioesterase-2